MAYAIRMPKIMGDLRDAIRHTRMNTISTVLWIVSAFCVCAAAARLSRSLSVCTIYSGCCVYANAQASSVFVHERNDRMMNEPWTNAQWTWSMTVYDVMDRTNDYYVPQHLKNLFEIILQWISARDSVRILGAFGAAHAFVTIAKRANHTEQTVVRV